jgi:hypothetical protein
MADSNCWSMHDIVTVNCRADAGSNGNGRVEPRRTIENGACEMKSESASTEPFVVVHHWVPEQIARANPRRSSECRSRVSKPTERCGSTGASTRRPSVSLTHGSIRRWPLDGSSRRRRGRSRTSKSMRELGADSVLSIEIAGTRSNTSANTPRSFRTGASRSCSFCRLRTRWSRA